MSKEKSARKGTDGAQESEKLQKKLRLADSDVKGYQSLLIRLALLALVIWALFFFAVGVMRVPNTDMSPRLDAGDMVLFYRLDKDVRAQDVIAIQKATPESKGEKTIFVLRVVAAPGDTVDIRDGRLFVNGNPQIETNIFFETSAYGGFTEYPLTLGEGQCFVLADRRSDGTDSRFFGAVEKDEILGTVIAMMRRNKL